MLLPASAFWGVPTITTTVRQANAYGLVSSNKMSPFALNAAAAVSAPLPDTTSLSSQQTKQAFDRLFVKFVNAGNEVSKGLSLDRYVG